MKKCWIGGKKVKLEIYMGQSVLLNIWLRYGNDFAAIALRLNVIKRKW